MQRSKQYLCLSRMLAFLLSGLAITAVQAGAPLWTFEPQTPIDITVTKGDNVQVRYTVNNQSSKAKTLVMEPIAGITQISPCQLSAKGNCTLTLNVDGSLLNGDVLGGPVLCQQGSMLQCYQPSSANILRIRLKEQPKGTALSSSTQELVLSINAPGINAALTGNQRTITITNTGSLAATNVQANASGFPSGTSISNSTCSGSLAASSTCSITISPGNAASSACTAGTQPVPGTVTVTADNAPPTNISVLVLGYGCIYQDGYVFAVDDTVPANPRIGGKVVSLADQEPRWPNGIAWDADPNCTPCTPATGAWDFNFGNNLASVPGSTNPNNTGTNGPGNTWLISDTLNGNNGNTNGPPATYAAGVCISYTGGGHNDWYLPALCDTGIGANCPSGTQQNIVENLGILLSDPNNNPDTSCTIGSNCLAGHYWTSTETSNFPNENAWDQFYATGGGSNQPPGGKGMGSQFGIRCVRDLTL